MVSSNALLEMFPATLPLLKYCELLFGQQDVGTLWPPAIRQLIDSVLVIPMGVHPHITLPKSDNKYKVPMRELLNRFVALEIQRKREFRSCNCLCFGYRLKNAHSASEMRSNLNTECYFVNTLHSVWCNADWSRFAAFVGDEVVCHLFSVPVFQSIENGCFLQLSGIPILELNRQANEAIKPQKFGLHRFLLQHIGAGGVPQSRVQRLEDTRIELPRYKIFYCHRYERYPGLPSKHILNKVKVVTICIVLFLLVFLLLFW